MTDTHGKEIPDLPHWCDRLHGDLNERLDRMREDATQRHKDIMQAIGGHSDELHEIRLEQGNSRERQDEMKNELTTLKVNQAVVMEKVGVRAAKRKAMSGHIWGIAAAAVGGLATLGTFWSAIAAKTRAIVRLILHP